MFTFFSISFLSSFQRDGNNSIKDESVFKDNSLVAFLLLMNRQLVNGQYFLSFYFYCIPKTNNLHQKIWQVCLFCSSSWTFEFFHLGFRTDLHT